MSERGGWSIKEAIGRKGGGADFKDLEGAKQMQRGQAVTRQENEMMKCLWGEGWEVTMSEKMKEKLIMSEVNGTDGIAGG